MRRPRAHWLALFLEFFIAALAEGLVAAAGWCARKLWRWWRRRRRPKTEDEG